MKYRLKANAASLASLAILSTMVLVTLSTVITLFAGMNSALDAKYSGTAMLNMDLNITVRKPRPFSGFSRTAGDHDACQRRKPACIRKIQ